MSFYCEVFCPIENWREKVLVSTLPREGDQLRHKDKLYSVSAAEHVLEPNADATAYGYLVNKPVVYVSPLK